mmetsp:Transcript_3102/g.7889  ORF Transcript_3102/g.7889 Transcript_3102/m.7889 type:complete len:336 (+) Transcript_3102:189-1196(+)
MRMLRGPRRMSHVRIVPTKFRRGLGSGERCRAARGANAPGPPRGPGLRSWLARCTNAPCDCDGHAHALFTAPRENVREARILSDAPRGRCHWLLGISCLRRLVHRHLARHSSACGTARGQVRAGPGARAKRRQVVAAGRDFAEAGATHGGGADNSFPQGGGGVHGHHRLILADGGGASSTPARPRGRLLATGLAVRAKRQPVGLDAVVVDDRHGRHGVQRWRRHGRGQARGIHAREPSRVDNIVERGALRRAGREHGLDEQLGIHRDVPPRRVGEIEILGVHVATARIVEGEVATKHGVEHDAEGPDVRLGRPVYGRSGSNLRGSVPVGALEVAV